MRPNPPGAARVISGLVALSNSSIGLVEQAAQLDDLGHQLVGKAAALDAEARGQFDQLGDLRQRLRAELAGFALQRMRGEHQRGRVLLAHRLLDLGDRFDAVFLEVTEDLDESGPELGPALLEIHPVDDVPSFVAHAKLLKRRMSSGRGPTSDRIEGKG